ncbi:MAG TPA: hypothetical protein ACFE0H_12880 [Elainellaceae cyanobacterium]
MSNDPSKSSESNRNQAPSESNSQRSPRDSQSAIALPDRLREIWKTAQPILRTQSIRAFHGLSQALRSSIQRIETSSPSVESARSNSQPRNGVTTDAANASDQQAIANHSQSDRQSSPAVSGSSTPKADNPLQTVQNIWRQVLPILRTQSVRVLRVLADASEWAVHRLSPADASAIGSRDTPRSQTWAVLDQSVAKLQHAWIWWSRQLSQLRDRLPASWRKFFSPPIVTSTLVILLVVLSWGIPGPSSAQAPERVQPSPIQAPSTADETPAMEKSDSSMLSSDRLGEQSETRAAESSPPLELTPEQSLIAAIQEEVAEITSQYADGLIQSVQANFRSSRLTANVSDNWYKLPNSRQDQLANEMLNRASALEFKALDLLDSQGNLLARSPVIGSTMIVLHRSHTSESP